MPRLLDEEVTASYAGLRAAIDHDDYLIELDAAQRYVLVGGIRSTGLTSSLAVAEYVRELLARRGLAADATAPNCRTRRGCRTSARRSCGRIRTTRAIAADPAYGTHRLLLRAGQRRRDPRRAGARRCRRPTSSGLRRRTRAMNGRCQGFYCGADHAASPAGDDQLA